ncbi:MAG: hypothetical protein AB2L24_17820 [Mangrovibacterium sp.]
MNYTATLGFILLVLLVSILNSSYPSFILSASRPVDLLKDKFNAPAKGSAVFTKSMVIVQFFHFAAPDCRNNCRLQTIPVSYPFGYGV